MQADEIEDDRCNLSEVIKWSSENQTDSASQMGCSLLENTSASCRKTSFFLDSTWQCQSFCASDESERRRLQGL